MESLKYALDFPQELTDRVKDAANKAVQTELIKVIQEHRTEIARLKRMQSYPATTPTKTWTNVPKTTKNTKNGGGKGSTHVFKSKYHRIFGPKVAHKPTFVQEKARSIRDKQGFKAAVEYLDKWSAKNSY